MKKSTHEEDDSDYEDKLTKKVKRNNIQESDEEENEDELL